MITVKFWHIALSFIIAQMLHFGAFVAVSQGQEPQIMIAGSSVISAHFDAGGTATATSFPSENHAKKKLVQTVDSETLPPKEADHSQEETAPEPKPEPLSTKKVTPEPEDVVQMKEPEPVPQEKQEKPPFQSEKNQPQKKVEQLTEPKPETAQPKKAQKNLDSQEPDQASVKDVAEDKGGQRDDADNQKKPTDSASSTAASLAGSSVASQAQSSATPGNAVSTNYAGKIMKHLSKFRRPRASSPGSALVTFTFTATGEIEAIEVSKSSGSYKFDKQAIKFIKRAAPFPSPPDEATRTFTVEIEGR